MMYYKVVFMRREQKKSVKNFFVNKSYYICPVNFKQNMNMKKIILSVVAVMAFGFANAQDKKEGGAGLAKGDLVMTGTVGFASVSNADGIKDAKASTFTLSPGAGYMMSDNLMLRAGLDVTSGTLNSGAPGADDAKTSGFGVNLGATYFFTPADKFSLGLGGRFSYASQSQDFFVDEETGEVVALDEDLKVNTISFEVPLSLHYFVSDNWAITSEFAGVGFESSKADVEGAEAQTTIGVNLDMSALKFGVLYKF